MIEQFYADHEPRIKQAVEQLIAKGEASWLLDPYVADTIGLIKSGTNDALIVVQRVDFFGSEMVDAEITNELDALLND